MKDEARKIAAELEALSVRIDRKPDNSLPGIGVAFDAFDARMRIGAIAVANLPLLIEALRGLAVREVLQEQG